MYKVLIVEDEDIIRKGLMFMVNWQQAGCVVAGEAADGLEGLEKIRETRPDIVIVDINMPVMDGLEMLEKSIQEYGYDAIIVSGYSEFEYARKAITLGVTAVSYTHLDVYKRQVQTDQTVQFQRRTNRPPEKEHARIHPHP